MRLEIKDWRLFFKPRKLNPPIYQFNNAILITRERARSACKNCYIAVRLIIESDACYHGYTTNFHIKHVTRDLSFFPLNFYMTDNPPSTVAKYANMRRGILNIKVYLHPFYGNDPGVACCYRQHIVIRRAGST